MNEIKLVNLTTGGAPIIAKVAIKDEYYILEDPFNILYVTPKEPTGEPKFNVFDMLVLSSDSSIEISSKHILFCNTPLPEILDQYNAMMMNKLDLIVDGD